MARHGRLEKSSPWRTIAKVATAVVGVIAVSGVSIAAYAVWDLSQTIKPSVTLGNESVLEGLPDVGAIDGGVNLLVIGSDSREGQGDGYGEDEEGTLNDVTMLLHIAEDHSHAAVVSFPRDMYVDVPECTDPQTGEELSAYNGKINSTLGRGGMACVVKTVEDLTGLTIPFAGVVQFNGVANLATAVGGVEVCVAERIEDDHTDTYLDPGTHSLTGLQALQFLRTRHGVGDGSDLGRISNQQVYMSSLARTLQSDGTLTDPVKLFGIAKVALANMTFSDSLGSVVNLVSIAKALKDTDLSQIAFVQYPTAYSGDGVVPVESAQIINLALQEDRPVVFDAEAQNNVSFGTVPDANQPVTEAPVEPEAPVDPEAPVETEAPVDPAAPTVEALPSDVYGMTAAESRCSSGRTFADQ
ncbi:LCP family protein [Agromyces atrinae]|uniref:LCP family protein required for cell wall assembly n=1 Tax=Agromyces atrinae TaxID=592376 RepID=A0A4Q2M8E9_9MICO|nr:LCP family protein [Agromyces atrinae]NYD67468.1 LCP family protein required for cell wall assembly [Agromyces atrinae]RXZ88308.1 LytR family transcriptional regulator [Agromyces atrinae]